MINPKSDVVNASGVPGTIPSTNQNSNDLRKASQALDKMARKSYSQNKQNHQTVAHALSGLPFSIGSLPNAFGDVGQLLQSALDSTANNVYNAVNKARKTADKKASVRLSGNRNGFLKPKHDSSGNQSTEQRSETIRPGGRK